MKKLAALLIAAFGISSFSAAKAETFVRPLNIQNAYIDTDKPYELRVNFDWFRSHNDVGGGVAARSSSYNLPRIDIRRGFDTAIPLRIGLNTAFNAGTGEVDNNGTENENSAIGFGNIGLTLEAALVNNEDSALTFYVNQWFPMTHNDLLVANLLTPVNGADSYSFQTGFTYQQAITDSITWFGDIAYRYDDIDEGPVVHSLVYYNELVHNFDNPFALSLGLLGFSAFDDDFGGSTLHFVPGFIVKANDENTTQWRFGMPIGLTSDSSDIGLQASLFYTF